MAECVRNPNRTKKRGTHFRLASWEPSNPTGFSPCGTAFGALRKCYSADCKFFADDTEGNRINWYFVPAGTPIYEGVNAFCPQVDFHDGTDPNNYEKTGPGRLVRSFNDGWDKYGFPKNHVHGDDDDFAGKSLRGKYDGPIPPLPPMGDGNTLETAYIGNVEDFETYPLAGRTHLWAKQIAGGMDGGVIYWFGTGFDIATVEIWQLDAFGVPVLIYTEPLSGSEHSLAVIDGTYWVHLAITSEVAATFSIFFQFPSPGIVPELGTCVGTPRLRAALVLGTSPRAFPPSGIPELFADLALNAIIATPAPPATLVAAIELAAAIAVPPPPNNVAGLEIAAELAVPPVTPPAFVGALQLAGSADVPIENLLAGLQLAAIVGIPAPSAPNLDAGLELALVYVDAPPPPPIYAKDNFTDTDGTLLNAHTMDVGSGWTFMSSESASIQSNRYLAGSIGSTGLARTDVGHTDYVIECDVLIPASPAVNYYGFYVRFVDSGGVSNSSGYQIAIFPDGDDCAIYEVPSFTRRAGATVTINPGTTYHLKAVVTGSIIAVYLDGAPICLYTSATTNPASTVVAVKGPSGAVLDNFLVTG